MARKRLFVDPARAQAPGGHALGDGARGVGQFGPSPVVDAHDQVERLAVLGRAVGLFEGLDDAGPQAGAPPAPAHVHAPLGELVGAPGKHVGGVVHDEGDLGGRAFPVFGGEGVDAQVAYARVDGARDGVHEGVLPCPVPLGACQAARVGPAPVSVHDEGDVCGDLAALEGGRGHVPLAGAEQGRGGVGGCAIHGGRTMGGHGWLLSITVSERRRLSRCH